VRRREKGGGDYLIALKNNQKNLDLLRNAAMAILPIAQLSQSP
jgi:hypothetical protein